MPQLPHVLYHAQERALGAGSLPEVSFQTVHLTGWCLGIQGLPERQDLPVHVTCITLFSLTCEASNLQLPGLPTTLGTWPLLVQHHEAILEAG